MVENIKTLPVIALRDMVILPGVLVHLDINRSITKNAVKVAMQKDGFVLLVNQINVEKKKPALEDLAEVGVIAKLRQVTNIKDNTVRILITAMKRASLKELIEGNNYITAKCDLAYDDSADKRMVPKEIEAMRRSIRELFFDYISRFENYPERPATYDKINAEEDLGKLLDFIAMNMRISTKQRLDILYTFSVQERFMKLYTIIQDEIDIDTFKATYRNKLESEIDRSQREYILREQLRVIKSELGEDDEESSDKYRDKLEELNCSEEIKNLILEQIERLDSLSYQSSEYSVVSDYLDVVFSLPWDTACEVDNDLENAETILDEDHYGLKKIKERIIEYLAVRILSKKTDAPILCLVGPPGTGKTSIAKSVARAVGIPYRRVCLGGVRDEAEIRGHRRTYIGAMPGRIVDAIKKAKVKNPLILLDEIDKVSSDYKGDTSSALLEVLDPEQNKNFTDHYVDLPMDLSEVLFMCTANSTDTIPRPLLDRMEVIEVSGYTENEKFHIAKEYLVPKQKDNNGIKKSLLTINDKAIKDIIEYYTREAGVRELERKIGKICRKTAKAVLKGEVKKISVSGKNLGDFLGKKKYSDLKANKTSEIGIVRGLAWTQVGGETLEVEVNIMPGDGTFILTGQLGDVMQESARIALSYVRSISNKSNDFYKEHDIHLHVPEGAVPKDGPSAGVTMATALYSAIEKSKVDSKVAMTGELTLRGKVLPIGGLKEKLLAAKTAGIERVVVPIENKPDVEELEEEIVTGMDILYAKDMKQVLKNALV